jgi:hypothetical protein
MTPALALPSSPDVGPALVGAGSALAVLVVVLLVWMLRLTAQVRRMRRSYARLVGDLPAARLDEVLQHYINETQHAAESVRQLRSEQEELTAAVRRAVQKIGMVRYSAFADTGGDQSFAVALLDREGNGALFNGLFHRTECRVYAKPVEGWRSRYSLSDEEEEAIRKAQQS